jgi:histidine triad (HIT) family protein
MPSECTFCRIASGEAPADVVYHDAVVTAFRDIAPQAPTHIVLIPNRHIPSMAEVDERDADDLSAMLLAAREIAAAEGLDGRGYRLVINTGANAGQSVPHLHLHILGGRRMRWPPG